MKISNLRPTRDALIIDGVTLRRFEGQLEGGQRVDVLVKALVVDPHDQHELDRQVNLLETPLQPVQLDSEFLRRVL